MGSRVHEDTAMSDTILAGYVDVPQFAAEAQKHPRTVVRWMDAENGLPFVQLGSRRLIHVPTAREWLLRKMRWPNPTRRSVRASGKPVAGDRRERDDGN
jgi:hypothetical protein